MILLINLIIFLTKNPNHMAAAYLNALKQLYQVNKFSKVKLDLTNISKFSEVWAFFIPFQNFLKLNKLEGNPHLKIPYIHVAGTNGKGSVALKISKILQNSGLKTGLYVSPHLFSFRERIQVFFFKGSYSINNIFCLDRWKTHRKRIYCEIFKWSLSEIREKPNSFNIFWGLFL